MPKQHVVRYLCALVFVAGIAVCSHDAAAPPIRALVLQVRGYELVGDSQLDFKLRLHNKGSVPGRVMHPRPSTSDLSPQYGLEVTKGSFVHMRGGCGNDTAVYSDENMPLLAPGEHLDFDWQFPMARRPASGRYQVRVTYTVRPDHYPGPEVHLPGDIEFGAWPRDVFQGTVLSEVVEVVIPDR